MGDLGPIELGMRNIKEHTLMVLCMREYDHACAHWAEHERAHRVLTSMAPAVAVLSCGLHVSVRSALSAS